MRELTQAETVALMAERKADAMQRLREEQPHLDMLDRAGRVHATVTRKGPVLIGQGGDGYRFAQIIQKAAGLDGFRLKSIECRVACKEVITFKAEIMGTAEDIADAIAANEEETCDRCQKVAECIDYNGTASSVKRVCHDCDSDLRVEE